MTIGVDSLTLGGVPANGSGLGYVKVSTDSRCGLRLTSQYRQTICLV